MGADQHVLLEFTGSRYEGEREDHLSVLTNFVLFCESDHKASSRLSARLASCWWLQASRQAVSVSAKPLLATAMQAMEMDLQVFSAPDGILTTKITRSHSRSTHAARLASLFSPWVCWRGCSIFRFRVALEEHLSSDRTPQQ